VVNNASPGKDGEEKRARDIFGGRKGKDTGGTVVAPGKKTDRSTRRRSQQRRPVPGQIGQVRLVRSQSGTDNDTSAATLQIVARTVGSMI
jgi:hypothetical protein